MLTVEMFWGKPNFIEVSGFDADGDYLPLHRIKTGKPLDPEYRFQRCSNHSWKKFISWGQQMGWIPMGIVLESSFYKDKPIISEYNPSS